jgi:hypothetical protein
MRHSKVGQFLKSKTGQVLVGLFSVISLWRLFLFLYAAHFSNLGFDIQIWGASYQILAFWGVVCGLVFSRLWGGWKSVIGRADILFALGLCGQLFGQCISSYYTITGGVLPYPSIADLGFFATIPLYTYGAILLARAGGAKIKITSLESVAQIVVIPLIMLCISFFVFLRGYAFDWSQPLRIFLDFGYPLGDAVYISAAILAFSLSFRSLGGVMRIPIFTFIIALVLQYLADFTFLYQNANGTFVVGGITDLAYTVSYFLMALSLIQLAVTFENIRNTSPQSIVGGALQGAISIFSQIASRIIREQALVIGPLAWTEAQKVSGLSIDLEKDEVMVSPEDGKSVVDRLVAQYERLFGRASHEVSREAVASIIAKMSAAEVPLSLRA